MYSQIILSVDLQFKFICSSKRMSSAFLKQLITDNTSTVRLHQKIGLSMLSQFLVTSLLFQSYFHLFFLVASLTSGPFVLRNSFLYLSQSGDYPFFAACFYPTALLSVHLQSLQSCRVLALSVDFTDQMSTHTFNSVHEHKARARGKRRYIHAFPTPDLIKMDLDLQ